MKLEHKDSLKDNTFTYHPKLALNSTRIVESLNTDFMSRQQSHIEKQKKIVSVRCFKSYSIYGNYCIYIYKHIIHINHSVHIVYGYL